MPIKTIASLSAAFICSLLFATTGTPATGAEENPINTATKHNTNWYTIQVSSCKNPQEAANEVTLLKTHGFPAVSSYEAVEDSGMWYRVYVGRFRTSQEAKTFASRLEAEGIISGYWINVLKDPDILPVTSELEQAEPTIAEEYEYPGQKESQVVSERPVEPQISPEEQVKTAPPPQVLMKDEGTTLIAPPEEYAGKPMPVEEPLTKTPTPELKDDSDKPVEPQVIPEDQVKAAPPPQVPVKDEDTTLIASAEEDAGEPVPVKEPLFQTPTPELKIDDKHLFSIALRPGGVYFPNLDKFSISTPTIKWHFEKKYFNVAIVPSFYLNKSFSLEGSLEKILNASFDFWYWTLGPKLRLTTSSNDSLFKLSPYIRGALARGDISWDDVPGSFDGSMGWDLGIGLDVVSIRSRLKLGLETSYRSVKFKYNIPSSLDVTSSQSKMDFSGYSFTGFMNFYF